MVEIGYNPENLSVSLYVHYMKRLEHLKSLTYCVHNFHLIQRKLAKFRQDQ
jgi:hypothetical protein